MRNSINIGEDVPIKTNLEILLSVIASWYKTDVKALSVLGSDRRSSQIRAVMAHLARGFGGVSLKQVADFVVELIMV